MSELKKVLERYRDPRLARRIAEKIRELASKIGEKILIMHVCGTHEWTITHYGIRHVLPENVEVRAGPGCPVCVLPAADIDSMIRLGLEERISILTFGDVSRARGGRGLSLEDARGLGLDLRIVYSFQDAVEIASREPERRFVFFGVGFDTTCPSVAHAVLRGLPSNMVVLSSHRYVPPAVGWVMCREDLEVDGFIAPGHSGTVTGMRPYREYFERNPRPIVFSGFEPLDVLVSIYMVLRQLSTARYSIENEYTRSVTWEGNARAMATALEVFELKEGLWRGIGLIEGSAFDFREKYSRVDARAVYGIEQPRSDPGMPGGCRCAEVIIGKATPTECPLYMRVCTPRTPVGPCMVSVEGTCKIWADHRILRREVERA
ncbi:MAG: hydrogenase formation protein HypD [Fervidicoccaceae archaeon]